MKLLRKLFPQRYAFKDRVEKRAAYIQSLLSRMTRADTMYYAERKEHEIDLAKQTGELDKYAHQIKVVEDFHKALAAKGGGQQWLRH